MPSSIKKIGGYAFNDTLLSKITIPASVNFIGAYAFYNTPLISATFEDTTGWSGLSYIISYRPNVNSGVTSTTRKYSLTNAYNAALALRGDVEVSYQTYQYGSMQTAYKTCSFYKNDWTKG